MSQRLHNDLAPSDTVFDEPGAAAEQDAAVAAAQAMQDAAGAQEGDDRTPEQLKADYQADLARRIEVLEARISAHVLEFKDRAWTARDGISRRAGQYAQYWRSLRKYRNEQVPTLNSDGSINESADDAHLKVGATVGLFTDNVNTVGPALAAATLGRGKQAYDLEPKGKKEENPLKRAMCIDMINSQLDAANWRGEMISALRDLPKHGTCLIRQSWVEEWTWERDENQDWVETLSHRGLYFKHWPLLDVFISNPLRKYAWEQDAVLWFSRTTLSQLAKQEKVAIAEERIETDPATGQPMKIGSTTMRGRFVGLERLRRRNQGSQASQKGFEHQGQEGNQNNEGTTRTLETMGEVSAETVLELFEFQGYFPIGEMIREGLLTPDMFDYFGIKLKIAGDQVQNEELARLADSLMWYIAVLATPGGQSGLVPQLIPCPYRKQRNELLSGVYVPDTFYGLSSDRLASDISDAADQLFNDIVRIIHHNANANVVGDEAKMEGGIAAIEKLLNETNKFIQINTGSGQQSPEEMLTYMQLPYDATFVELLSMLREIYSLRTMSNSILQGGEAQTETDTLGEANIQVQGVEARLADVIRRLAEITIVRRSIMNLLEDIDWFYTRAELTKEAQRVSGETALDAADIFPTAEEHGPGGRRRSLADDFIVKAAASAEIDKAVAIQFMDKEAQLNAANPQFNAKQLSLDKFSLMGLDGSKYWIDEQGPLSPRQIAEMIVAGDRPKLDPLTMDAFMYQTAFMQIRDAWILARDMNGAAGRPTDAWDGWIQVLERLIVEAVELGQQQAMLMQQQAMAAGAAPSGPGAMGGGGSPGPSGPQGQQGMKRGIEKGANDKPDKAKGGTRP